MNGQTRGRFRRRRRAAGRGSSDVISVFVVLTVVVALGTGLALVATGAVDNEAREASRERAEYNARFGVEYARKQFKPWLEEKLGDAVRYANHPDSTWDLTKPFLQEVSIDDYTIEEQQVPGADKEAGVDVVSTRTRFWLTAPPTHPAFDALAKRGGGAGSDGNHADLYLFAYRTEATGRSAHDAKVALVEEGTVPVAILVDLTIGGAYEKGAASSGGFDGMGDFSAIAAEPLSPDGVPNPEDRFGPPVFVGAPEEIGGVEVTEPDGSMKKYGQKIYVYTVKGLAEPLGSRRGALGGIQVMASFNGRRLQSHILYQDAWRRSPDYDPDRDALKVVHEDGTVEYWKGPDGKLAVVGPSTSDFYELVSATPEGMYVRRKDGSLEVPVELYLFIPGITPEQIVKAPIVAGRDSEPITMNLSKFDTESFSYDGWRVVHFGSLTTSTVTGGPRFSGQVAFLLTDNHEAPAMGFLSTASGALKRLIRITKPVGSAPGRATVTPFNTALGVDEPAAGAEIDRLWRIRGSLSGARDPWYPTVTMVTLRHTVTYDLYHRDADDLSWVPHHTNEEYEFTNAMIQGQLYSRPGVNPPGRHLEVWAAALTVVPTAQYRLI